MKNTFKFVEPLDTSKFEKFIEECMAELNTMSDDELDKIMIDANAKECNEKYF